jgi:outer membrane lipoprotein SlyB
MGDRKKTIRLDQLAELITFGECKDGALFIKDVRGDVYGDVVGHVFGDIEGHVLGDIEGSVHGDILGNVQGSIEGDVKGSVCGDSGRTGDG